MGEIQQRQGLWKVKSTSRLVPLRSDLVLNTMTEDVDRRKTKVVEHAKRYLHALSEARIKNERLHMSREKTPCCPTATTNRKKSCVPEYISRVHGTDTPVIPSTDGD
eukprot:360355-Amphidinium_carterae.1